MRHVMIACALAVTAFSASCSRSPVAPATRNQENPGFELTERLETEHFVFHYAPGDYVEAQRAEAFHRWAMDCFGLTTPRKVDYYKVRDREQMWRVLASPYTGFAYVNGFEVWTYVPFLNHELVHIYSGLFAGWPTTFFVEGLAQAYMVDPYRNDYVPRESNGEPLYDVARRFKAQGRLYPLAAIVTATGWSANNPVVTYVEAGAFVRYLIERDGITKFRALWAAVGSRDGADLVAARFSTVYGRTLSEAEADWLAWLDQR